MNRLVHRTATTAAGLLPVTTAACGGGGDGGGSAEPAGEATSQSPTSAATTLETSQSRFGQILVDSQDMAPYTVDNDWPLHHWVNGEPLRETARAIPGAAY